MAQFHLGDATDRFEVLVSDWISDKTQNTLQWYLSFER